VIFNHLLATVLIGLAFLNRWCSAAESGTAGIRKQTCKLISVGNAWNFDAFN